MTEDYSEQVQRDFVPANNHGTSYSDRHTGDGDPSCQMCFGVGYYRYDVGRGHEKYGTHVCSCQGINTLMKTCGVKSQEEWARKPSDYWRGEIPARDDMEKAVLYAIHKAVTLKKPSGWLTLVGEPGCGKSTWSQRLVMESVRAGISAYYVSMDVFHREIEDSFQLTGTPRIISRMIEAPVLVIDNVIDNAWKKTGGQQSWYSQQVLLMAEARYRSRGEKTTVWTTNDPWWDNRLNDPLYLVYDRMQEGDIARVKGVKGVRAAIGAKIKEERNRVIAELGA